MDPAVKYATYPFMQEIKPHDPDGYYCIPDLTIHNLQQFILVGQPGGDFVLNLLSGNPFKAVAHADSGNMHAFAAIVRFLANRAPMGCYGSPFKYRIWSAHGGLVNYSEYEKLTRLVPNTLPEENRERVRLVLLDEIAKSTDHTRYATELMSALAAPDLKKE